MPPPPLTPVAAPTFATLERWLEEKEMSKAAEVLAAGLFGTNSMSVTPIPAFRWFSNLLLANIKTGFASPKSHLPNCER